MPFTLPEGKKFAFTILDDTDVGTLENIRPVYDRLQELGFRTTKTVWLSDRGKIGKNGRPSGRFGKSDTLSRPDYLEYVLSLQSAGFEITWHCPAMKSSNRVEIIEALANFTRIFGCRPRVHANHATNRENIYWGEKRVDDWLVSALYRAAMKETDNPYSGEIPGSDYWWGDLCHENIDYARNLTFPMLNMLRVNPSMPYHDPKRPLVKYWFSTADADSVTSFNELVTPQAQDRLAEEGGVCIVSTHFGKGFSQAGRIDRTFDSIITRLASMPGWFVPVGTLLDYLRAQGGGRVLPADEWKKMQRKWMMEKINRGVREKIKWVNRR